MKIILTNMTMLYKMDPKTKELYILVQNRVKNDWPGLNFPGGHVKSDESISDSAIREMKEETNLEVTYLEFVSFYEWNLPKEETRHLAILYRSKDFKGELKSSGEGKMLWLKVSEINNYPLSTDFDKLVNILTKDLI